ncbi:hypothetical protein PENTCL1PPCAC_26731, partial [Pristionchus entomophagus]
MKPSLFASPPSIARPSSSSSSPSLSSSFFTLFSSIPFSSSSSCESHLPYMNFPVPFIFFAFGLSIISPSPPESIGESAMNYDIRKFDELFS